MQIKNKITILKHYLADKPIALNFFIALEIICFIYAGVVSRFSTIGFLLFFTVGFVVGILNGEALILKGVKGGSQNV